jgi:hypothetical protein
MRSVKLPYLSLWPRGIYTSGKEGNFKVQPDSFQKALEGFSGFVNKTFRALVKKEEEMVGVGNSDLRVFCRMDFVPLEEQNNRLDLFVNGVRGMGAGLFLGHSDPEEMVEFSKDIAVALRTWVAIRRSLKDGGEGMDCSS